MQAMLDQIPQYLPRLIGMVAILVVGWLGALLVSAIVRGTLRRTKLDDRLSQWAVGEEKADGPALGRWIGKGVFYLIMIFVLVAFLQYLGLTIVTEPLNRLLTQLAEFAPRLLAAGVLLLIAWILARLLRFVIQRGLTAAKIDERLGSKAGIEEDQHIPLSRTVANAVYWLVFLVFLPAILDALAMQGLLDPVKGMLDNILGYLPALFGAALIVLIGWFVARIVRRVVAGLLASVGVDRLSERVGLAKALGGKRLSDLLGLVVYVLILIPVAVGALNALGADAITKPASDMLNMILAAIPRIFAAGLLLGVAYIVGRLLAGLVSSLLAGMGFDSILVRLGLASEPVEGKRTPSEMVGYLILALLMLFASIEAFRLMGFTAVGQLATQLTALTGRVIIGLIIMGVGVFLGNLAAKAIQAGGKAQAGFMATAARVAILILFGAVALRQMGLANEIINMAFGLMLGAIAVAVALAFGIGGREVAGRKLAEWASSAKLK